MSKSKLSVLAAALSEKSGLSMEDAEKFIKQMFDVANDALQQDKIVKMKWLGTFKVQSVKDRESIDVNTGERILIKSLAFAETNDLNVTVPDINSDTVHQYTMRYSIYDQYNVRWLQNSATLTADTQYPGVSFSDNRLLIDKAANDISPNTAFNIYAVYNSSGTTLKSAPRRIVVSPNKIPYKFVNYDGTVLEEGSEYAGVTPVYHGETPKRAPDEKGHYTFTSWTPLQPLSSENNTYTAFFTANDHLVSKTDVKIWKWLAKRG